MDITVPPAQKGIVIRMSRKTRACLEALARSRRCSVHDVLNEAICCYLDEEAWLGDEIKAAVNEADAPDAAFVPHSEVMAGLEAAIGQKRLHSDS